MNVIGVTGMSGSGKTTFSNNVKQFFANNETSITIIEVDQISREAFDRYPDVITETIKYLNSRYGISINNGKQFWEMLKLCRFEDELMQDPLYYHICSIIDEVMQKEENGSILIDWSMLPKSKYFSLCTRRVLIKPLDDEQRLYVLEQRDGDMEKIKRRDKYGVDYSKYSFDDIVQNDYMETTTFMPLAESLHSIVGINKR